jgi:N-acetylglutamate synthase-like GNAT family acetyltransferase
MSLEHPPYPPLGKLRLATIHDIPRIAEVALAGFSHTPVFAWSKPYHHQYPGDTFKAFQYSFARDLCDPGYVIVVAEDGFKPSENEHINATIVPTQEIVKPKPGESIIVGVALIKLSGNARWHQFNCKGDNNFHSGRNRDVDTLRSNMYEAKYEEAIREWEFGFLPNNATFIDFVYRYFGKHQLLEMLAVHPAYWYKGHGTALVKWGLELAKMDSIPQGVVASVMGEKLYIKLGYKLISKIKVGEKDNDVKEFEIGILRYTPEESQ